MCRGRSLGRGWAELQRLDATLGDLLQEGRLDFVLEHVQAEPLIAVANDLGGVEFAQLARPVGVLEGPIDRRCKKERQEDWSNVGLAPEVLLFEVAAERKALDALGGPC